MDYVLIVFASATTANKMKSIMKKKLGIDAVVLQTPKALPVVSCSYCLKIRKEHLEAAWELVKQSGVSTKGAFRNKDFLKLI